MRTTKSRRLISRKLVAGFVAIAVVGLVAGAVGCAGKPNPGYPTPTAEAPAVMPQPDQFGIVKAEQWKDIYPNQYNSYLKNADNAPIYEEYTAEGVDDTTSALYEGYTPKPNDKADYTHDLYPEIQTLGKGYGYAKYYTEPASHVYSLWTVTHNGRVGDGSKTKTGCITCKTPQFSKDVDAEGNEIFSKPFNDYIYKYDENISCASCHGNDPTTLRVDRAGWTVAMGDDADKYSLQGQVCGQCHCDYSMDPVTSVPTSPYDGVASMVPDKALQWYDDHNYVDWTYETTGAKMIAVRHAEYEFNYGGEGNHMTNMGYDCNDCHMPATFAEDGTAYSDHNWQSPLDNEDLIKRDCSTCHKDIKAEVKAWQDELDGRDHQDGLRCEKFVHNFEDAIAKGTLTDEQTSRLQYIQRAATYYWNFVGAENSEGAHNPQLVRDTLSKCEALLDEADGILGVSSVVES